jgi:hypothetical protein
MPDPVTAIATMEPLRGCHREAVELRRPLALGAFGSRARTSCRSAPPPDGGTQAAGYVDAQSLVQRVNAAASRLPAPTEAACISFPRPAARADRCPATPAGTRCRTRR